jgi:hypothetical protein
MGRVDLKVQSYQGHPVLTWWEGQIVKGTGEGHAIIADTSYRTIATVSAGHGLRVDLHEFVISPQDTRVNPAGGSVVYASWNGATEVDTWTVLAGPAAGALATVGAQRRSGFETTITVNSTGPYFAMTAQDASGHPLGRSATVRLAS